MNAISQSLKLFLIKLLRFEFWPWKLFYSPLLPYYFYLSGKNGSLTFPSIVNPSLKNGGFFDENKQEVLERLPTAYLPKSLFVAAETSFNDLLAEMRINTLMLPVVAKPLNEQRGRNVEIINDERALAEYAQRLGKAFVVQEFVTYPIELAIVYSRLPNEAVGVVSSITQKEFLHVIGNGKDSIETLLRRNVRAKMIWEDIQKNVKIDWQAVLPEGEIRIVENIGNHCRGTIFRNAENIDKKRVGEVMDTIMRQFDGFYYGRFDLKVKSIEDLYNGENIAILELNGVNADAAHVFDPDYPLLRAYKDIAWHWKRMSDIARINAKFGYQYGSFAVLLQKLKKA